MPSVRAAAGLAVALLTSTAAAAGAGIAPPHGRPDLARTPPVAHAPAPRAAGLLANRLGSFGVVDIDPTTRTPRNVANLEGFLTGPATGDAADVVLAYVRAHRDVFRLSDAEIGDLQQVRRYTDVTGITHVVWRQWHGRLPVVDADLRANVMADGRIVSIQGAPVADFGGLVRRPMIHSARAVQAAGAGTGVTGARSGLALAPVPGGVRLVYHVTGMAGANEAFQANVDALTGRTLERHNMIKWADGDASVWRYYPSSAGGQDHARTPINFATSGWLDAGAPKLDGPNAHVYSDTSDDDVENPSDQITSDSSLAPFKNDFTGTGCTSSFPCTWNPAAANSWSTNRNQSGAQAFYFINTYHDWLAASPIGFNAAAGNFQGNDYVEGQILNGAAKNAGLPSSAYIDNSDFIAMPDGTPSYMELDLFRHDPSLDALAGNAADEADVVYHEYTHGLSGRTVANSDGTEAVDGVQAGALGEAWSDWYAMDFLVHQTAVVDGPTPDIMLASYLLHGAGIRTEPMDCPVAHVTGCDGAGAAGAGGYTYGDLGKIDASGPEVHADGEIWSQTLWQMRTALATLHPGPAGEAEARQLVTVGMRLTPPYPSFLDARNAIVQATYLLHPADLATVWNVFRSRGMGFWASTYGDEDATPVQNFELPPAAGARRATVTGTAVDSLSGAPIGGVAVDFGGHETPGATQTLLTGRTDAKGRYALPHVPEHVYPQLFFDKARYFGDAKTSVRVAANPTRLTPAKLTRDWAMFEPFAALGSDETTSVGCGPRNAIDGTILGWLSRPTGGHHPTLTVALAGRADLYRIGIAPWLGCPVLSDAASLGLAKIETSRDRHHWQSVGDKRFTSSDLDFEVPFKVPASMRYSVRYVRVTMLRNQGGDSTAPGYVGMGEVTVYALPAFSAKLRLQRRHGGRATARLTCNQPCSTRIGRTRVALSAAGTTVRSVKARGHLLVSITATRTGRRITKSVRVK